MLAIGGTVASSALLGGAAGWVAGTAAAPAPTASGSASVPLPTADLSTAPGVDPTGRTDSAPGLNAALAALAADAVWSQPSSGDPTKTVHVGRAASLPAGDFRIDAPLTLPLGVSLLLDPATRLRAGATMTAILVSGATRFLERVTISGGLLDCAGHAASGLVTARVLTEIGHDVAVFEKAPDLGGVWSSTRSYPGISTQDDRRTYAYSDEPMPADYPAHPSGAQVRAYLERYAAGHGIDGLLRLGTEVVAVEAAGDGWTVRSQGPSGAETDGFDRVVMANGVFSTSHVPDWPGRAAFDAAGGRVVTPSDLGDGAGLIGRRVAVIGWGKTACDVAAASAGIADSTVIVARVLRWKHPKRIGRWITFRHVLLTRLGEHLLAAPHRSLAGRALSKATGPLRTAVDRRLATVVARQLDLDALGLRPAGPYSDSNALVTEGFFEAVAERRLAVHRDASVSSLDVVDGRPVVRLSDGTVLDADVVVPATGYEQVLEPLSPEVRAALLGADGDLRLHRGILPARVPGLAFIGWLHTFHSPLSHELQATWLAAHLDGVPAGAQDEWVYRLTHRRAAAAGQQQLPSSTWAGLDALMADLGVPLPAGVRLRQVIVPIDPKDYAGPLRAVRQRLAREAAAAPRPVEHAAR